MENTGAKMKKLAINLLKTADEKLRNIGRHQSATVVQTQNFTFYKNNPKRENDASVHPLQQQKSEAQSELQQGSNQPEPEAGQREEKSLTEVMDERVVLRHVRRERNGHRPTDETESTDLKRRSRSEGPNRRIRQSMDERESGKKQTFDGGGRGRKMQESSDSDDSDRNPRQVAGGVGFDSESDSDHKKWTKNPLVVRRVKRSEKTKQVEKRFSGTENGLAAKNRDSWVYYGNEDGGSRTGSLGGGNSSSRDSGSSAKGSSKYQKLEEMRKKRINLAVTSDEENTPASRISRLRQRALQGGLGDQLKSSNNRQSPASSNYNVQGEYAKREHQQRSQQVPNLVSSDPGIRKIFESNSELGHQSVSTSAKQQYGHEINTFTQLSSFANQPHPMSNASIKPAYSTNTSSVNQNVQPMLTKISASLSDANLGLTQPLPRVQDKPTITKQIQPQKQAPARPPPPNVSLTRPLFYTIPEPNSSQSSRALNNSSPEVTVRRFTTQVRIPSSDSIVNSTSKTGMATGNTNQPVTFSNNLRQIQARGSPTPNQELFQAINNSRPSSQFNDVVEMRLKTNREPQPRIPKKSTAKSSSFAYSDDTLDELVESNIQYLDSDVDKAKIKKTLNTSVSRSSSLPDPRRISSHATSTPILNDQPSIQVQANNSIEIHVSLPTEPRHSGSSFKTPVIQIAPSGVVAYKSDYGLDSHLMSQPDVVPRKYSYDSHSRMSRPNSEYFDRDDMSKSDSQLNAQIVIPSYLGNNLHPDQAYARGCVSDLNLRSDHPGSGLQAPQVDTGMFSDVEYDIQVSERVKKWETFMKVHDGQISSEHKNLNLTTIQENNESESLMLPSEVRKSVLLTKNGAFVSPYSKDVTFTPPTRSRPFSSDSCLNKPPDLNAFKMFSVENANKFIHFVPDPQVGPRIGIQARSVTSLFHTPVTSRPEKHLLTANEVRQQMLANRQPALPITRSPVQGTLQSAQLQLSDSQNSSQKDTPVMWRSSNVNDIKEVTKRGSRYHDELNELSNVKADSVINLRRRFGADSAAGTSEDDQWSVSTASAKLSRPSKTSPSHSEADSLDLSSVLPGYESRIKDTDLWSPNLETTQGIPVSIERVTARTLQTIPFSEDPFWKEIEEMTSFDPTSMAGHLSVSKAHEIVSPEPMKSQHQVELASPHSSTLPNQPRNSAMTLRERMQRSKSLYTPNITPLSINVPEKSSSSAVSALDDVLEDISRSSMERRQLSPKKKALDTATASSANSGISNVPGYLKVKHDPPQSGFKFEGGQFTFMKPSADSQSHPVKTNASSNLSQGHSEKVTVQSKQPLQFYQQQRKEPQQQTTQNRQSQILTGGVSNYHLDPNLLKQKLLNTGLVVETDTEEPVAYKQSRSSSLGSSAPVFVAHSTTTQSYTALAPNAKVGVRSEVQIQPLSSHVPSQLGAAPPRKEPNPTAPWAAKQPGPSALYDIQKALAPFETSSYQPDPETLYGTSRLQSFNEPNFNTSRGPHVTATSWTYQPQIKKDNEISRANDKSSSNSLNRLQEVNASMDDLKELAQNVERKINDIKGKLQTADEKSLDSILASLRKLTPEVKSQIADKIDFDDYYSAKKSKLSDALTELNRIYDDLELSNSGLSRLPERGKHKPYRTTKSSDFVIAPVPKSEHLRPMQTRISSVFIPGLERNIKSDLDKETESEFDILSKSFQAIVDEVNETTDMFSRVVENSGPENVAPETQNQASKISLKPEGSASMKVLFTGNSDDASDSKLPPSTAPKPLEVKPKGGRFRSKFPGSVEEDDPSVTRNRSKSVPSLDSNTKDLLGATTESSITGSLVTQTPDQTTTKVTATCVTATATMSPASQQRSRVRPVRDNKIIQDDKASKKQGVDKGNGITQSPQPSPIVSRKIIFNNGTSLDLKSQPPQIFNEVSKDDTAATNPSQQQNIETQKANAMEETCVNKAKDVETKPTLISSPASQKKVPPPTAAKPNARSEMSISVLASTDLTSSTYTASSDQHETLPVAQLLNTNKEKKNPENGQKQTSSTMNISLAPVVTGSSMPSVGSGKQDDSDTGSGGQRTKRRLGTGVAMILDKFSTGDDNGDKMKKRQGTRSAPDLIESLNDGDDDAENSEKTASAVKTQAKQFADNKQVSSKGVKNLTQRPTEKRIPVLTSDGNKSSLSKSLVVTSFEKKITDPEVKASSSGTSTPQPSSPNSKPPQHPWKRQMSDPDKQIVSDVISESIIASPKFVSKIPRLITAPRSVAATPVSDNNTSPQKSDIHSAKVESPRVTRRTRPPERKMKTDTLKDRPHSFHELISCFETDPNRLQNVHKFRKYASADEVNSETLVRKVFLSGSSLSTGASSDVTGDNRGVVFKLEMKLKS